MPDPTLEHYEESVRHLARLVNHAPGHLAFPLPYRLALQEARRFLDSAPRREGAATTEPQAE